MGPLVGTSGVCEYCSVWTKLSQGLLVSEGFEDRAGGEMEGSGAAAPGGRWEDD